MEKGKKDLVVETRFKVTNQSTVAAFNKQLLDTSPIKYQKIKS